MVQRKKKAQLSSHRRILPRQVLASLLLEAEAAGDVHRLELLEEKSVAREKRRRRVSKEKEGGRKGEKTYLAA
jgi:hypothetical protein